MCAPILAAAHVTVVRSQFRAQRNKLLPRVDGAASVNLGERSERSSSASGNGSSDATVYPAGIGVNAFTLALFGHLIGR